MDLSAYMATGEAISLQNYLMNIGAALAIGLFLALMYSVGTRTTKSFLSTVFLLPAVVAMVIMMVNGSIGAGVAVAGAFSLVRFRSVPGSAREIAALFLAMSCGLACGMGQLLYGILFAGIMGLVLAGSALSPWGGEKQTGRQLKITIPEDLDYGGIFDDILERYTSSHTLDRVKTTNMGSMMKLTYRIDLKEESAERDLINEIRIRNGNLEVSVSREGAAGEL